MKPAVKNRVSKQQHLIMRLGKGVEDDEEEETVQCRYGVLCAHLRARGLCQMPHRKSHFLYLNIPPPSTALPDRPPEEEEKLSKRQRKEQKIMEKTIKENIDVEALEREGIRRQEEAKVNLKKQRESKMQAQERDVVRAVQSLDSSQFFDKLNTLRNQDSCLQEIKKKAMVQIHKKNSKLYSDIIDKQYRIANRLIKEAAKREQESLVQVYEDINHNSIPSVRQYFAQYFDAQTGIPTPAEPPLSLKGKVPILSKLMTNLFSKDPQHYQAKQHFLVKHKSAVYGHLFSNVEFYNLMIPFSLSQSTPFNLYLLINKEEDLTFSQASLRLVQAQLLTIHVKPKPPPEYPFGHLQANTVKFKQWVSKFKAKYLEGSKDSRFVFIFQNSQIFWMKKAANEIEQHRSMEQQAVINTLLDVLSPTCIVVSSDVSEEFRDKLKQRIGGSIV